MIGGPSNAGGLFLDRVQRWLGAGARTGLDAVGPADLPVWLPYVRGERTPLHRRDLRASLHDVALHHEPGHLLQAAYEAAGFVVRHHIDLARAVGLAPRRIVATGGGTQVAPWMQALADCTDLPVDVAAVPEGAALGSAFIARCVAGLESSMTDARRWAPRATPSSPAPTGSPPPRPATPASGPDRRRPRGVAAVVDPSLWSGPPRPEPRPRVVTGRSRRRCPGHNAPASGAEDQRYSKCWVSTMRGRR